MQKRNKETERDKIIIMDVDREEASSPQRASAVIYFLKTQKSRKKLTWDE